MTRRRFRQLPDGTLKEIPVTTVRRTQGSTQAAPAIHGDIDPFVSPIDGRVISSRAALRRHNEEHNVVQHRELGPGEGQDYLKRQADLRQSRLRGQLPQQKRERKRQVIETYYQLRDNQRR